MINQVVQTSDESDKASVLLSLSAKGVVFGVTPTLTLRDWTNGIARFPALHYCCEEQPTLFMLLLSCLDVTLWVLEPI